MSIEEVPAPLRSTEIPVKCSTAVHRIGSAIGFRLLSVNDPIATAAQEYYVAKQIANAAEDRLSSAKAILVSALSSVVPMSSGKHVVHDSATVVVTADQRAHPSKLDEEILASLMMDQFGCTLAQAQKVIANAKVRKPGFVTHWTTVMK
jgi:hypothetical protein